MKAIKIALLILLGITTIISATTSSKGQVSLLHPVISIEGKIIIDNHDKLTMPTIFILDHNNKKIAKFNVNQIDKTFYITGLKPNTQYYIMFTDDNLISEKILIATPITDKFIEIQQNLKIKTSQNKLETAKK